jgi:hypothetical protein
MVYLTNPICCNGRGAALGRVSPQIATRKPSKNSVPGARAAINSVVIVA